MVEGFGISLGVSPRESLRQVGEFARTMEASGFDALWYIDHQLGMKDVYATLNVVALNTERVRIGAGVTNFETRHPTVTANATVALDELSDGRALLGLGAGWVAVHSIGRRPTKLAEIRAGDRALPHAVCGRGDGVGRRAGAARDRGAADPHLPGCVAAAHADAMRRTLRRRGADGRGRS